jgi:rhodanese-related sulfurtransferase
LFRRGDNNGDLFYLLNGTVGLQADALKIEAISANSESARFAIAHQVPRKVDAVAINRIQFLRLDANMLKSIQALPNDENESNMIVEELEENDDWMTTLLKSPIFRVLPPANLQRILMSLEEVRFNAGELIIRQGEPGDYYYIIKKGKALISRKPSPSAKEIKLAQIGDLDSFGDDALISGEPRNVSVTALTDVSLFRLGKEQFLNLIKKAILKYVDFQDVRELVVKGATLIDVREPDEYKHCHLPLSMNVPFFSLRMHLKNLNRQQAVIVVCQNGKISEAAAFTLVRHKFNALILKDGINGVSAEQLKGPASFPIDDGVESSNLMETSHDEEAKASFQQVSKEDDVTQLRHDYQQLKSKYEILETQKNALDIKFKALVKYAESLKAELEAIKKASGTG